jgi:hypothetical protein
MRRGEVIDMPLRACATMKYNLIAPFTKIGLISWFRSCAVRKRCSHRSACVVSPVFTCLRGVNLGIVYDSIPFGEIRDKRHRDFKFHFRRESEILTGRMILVPEAEHNWGKMVEGLAVVSIDKKDVYRPAQPFEDAVVRDGRRG